MVKTSKIPILSEKTSINEAIYPISSQGLGLALVKRIERLLGFSLMEI